MFQYEPTLQYTLETSETSEGVNAIGIAVKGTKQSTLHLQCVLENGLVYYHCLIIEHRQFYLYKDIIKSKNN